MNFLTTRKDGIYRYWYRLYRYLVYQECTDCGFNHGQFKHLG